MGYRRSQSGYALKAAYLFTAVLTASGALFSAPLMLPLSLHQLSNQSQVQPAWQDTYAKADCLYRAGKYDEAYRLWAMALKEAEGDDSGVKSAEQIDVLRKMCLMYKTQGKPEMAAKSLEKAAGIANSLYGRNSSQVSQLLLELGRIYQYSDGPRGLLKADEVLGEAFRINERLYGKYTIATGDVAIALAMLRQTQNRDEEAADYFKLAVEIGNRLEPNTISCCRIGPRQGLARSYEKLGRYCEALSVHRELVSMARAGAHNMLYTVLTAYGECLAKNGDAQEAGKMLKEASLAK